MRTSPKLTGENITDIGEQRRAHLQPMPENHSPMSHALFINARNIKDSCPVKR